MEYKLEPYLIFNGQAGEAMEFYKSIFGGELYKQTYGEAGQAKPGEEKRIMHAYLKNEPISFMASDSPADPDKQAQLGNNVHMSISGANEAKLKEYWSKLSEGAKIDTPLEKQFWGATFGMLTDKFGIHWMINITTQK